MSSLLILWCTYTFRVDKINELVLVSYKMVLPYSDSVINQQKFVSIEMKFIKQTNSSKPKEVLQFITFCQQSRIIIGNRKSKTVMNDRISRKLFYSNYEGDLYAYNV